MVWFIVMHLFSALFDLIRIGRFGEDDKDLEILLLRQQLGIAERKLHKPVLASRVERLTLAVLTTKLRSSSTRTIEQLRQVIRIFQPETILGWHRQLVKRKLTYNPSGRGGRPRIDRELEYLVVRLAQENSDWGYDRISGELAKLGYTVSDETIANILRRHNIPPAPDRRRSPSWRHLMTHYKDQILACDFFRFYEEYLSDVEPRIELNLSERIVPIIEGIVSNSGYEEEAVNIPNSGLIAELPDWIVVGVPATVDREGIHGIRLDGLPRGFAGLLINQVAVHDLTCDAVIHRSKEAALQALLVAPVVNRYHELEELLDTMISYQEKWLGYLQ